MLPKEWERKPIKDVCDSIIDCVNKTAPVVDYKTPFKMLRTTNIRDGRVNTKDVRYVTEYTYKEWVRRGAPKVGDLIFTREAPVGEIGVLEDDNGIFLGQRTMMYRANLKKADNYFLFYSLQSRFCQKQIEDFSNGGTVAHMRVPDCGEIIVNIPPLPEQKKIAQILFTWDKAITTTEQLLANSQQQKKALMQQLLTGKKRLKGVGSEWKSNKLGEFFSRVTEKNNGQSINVVTISGQQGLIRQDEFFKKSIASDILDEYFLLRKGQFAYNKSYSNGYPMGAIKRLNRYDDGVVTTLYICFEVSDKDRADADFFEHYFESGLMIKGLMQIANEGGRAHGLLNVKPSDFFNLKINIPSFEEQQKIAAVLSAADREIEVLQQKLEGLKQEKKALMQQLLTGKRRVKV
ncbi:restriction endonuclease subunit S [Thiothrix subterranea]|uniref:restriction endonuclease subunit S n=1 Tax=Thiothrix subterranea TaxID=2735563 RepID=UPI00192CB3CF|nr:restriction endonuclease subunit S [Thiothrix subterranea]QQZ29375.1 restriction endonuclease subunit S [Thiothrix subterranea]